MSASSRIGGMATARELLLAERRRARQRVAAFERQHAAALREAARDQLAAVDAALRGLESGRYGVCDRCGQPIGSERLAARPAATTCIRCAAGDSRR